VKIAFKLYATGNYGDYDLHDALTDAGLRSKTNRRHGHRPVSIHTIGTMLRETPGGRRPACHQLRGRRG
jgi:hypothetical protein